MKLTSIVVIGLFISLIPVSLSAQYTSVETASGKQKKAYEKALEYSKQRDYSRAKHQLLQLLLEDSTFIDAHIQLAYVHYDQDQFALAERGMERALQLDPNYKPILYYQIGLAEWNQEKMQEAYGHFQTYLETGKGSDRQREKAQQYVDDAAFAIGAMANPVPFSPQPLPPTINTDQAEYLPCLTADGTRMIFTRVVDRNEDFFESVLENDQWSQAYPISAINTPDNEGAQCISPDGRYMVFTRCFPEYTHRSCDLFYSEKVGDRWTTPQPIGPPINTSSWESQPTLSPNGKALYFSSNRPGAIGGKDLWVSYRQSDDSWGEPQNLGPKINTTASEQSPFIHPDNQTLYFMSSGHPGLGGHDLYYSRKDSTGAWGEPQNLGYPINTKANEGALIVSLDGRTAFFATDQKDPANPETSSFEGIQENQTTDIFYFELYQDARPAPVTYVRARVFDAVTKFPLVAEATFIDLTNNEEWASSFTDFNGEFLVVLPAGEDYALNVSKEGYFFSSENFSFTGEYSVEEPYTLDIYLQPIPEGPDGLETGTPIVLRNIFFEFDKDILKPESKTELELLHQLLLDYPQLQIQINGHTDSDGNDAYNQDLSQRRAAAVKAYLTAAGIASSRLRSKGFGESRPIAPNDTPEGRQLNRRTEFEIIK
ncbi:MAG: PD40 domain-containing protein [Saprospiraceae bacterium]|nr:PD40 domain-containing protein [Saprospiraceae bacterium]